MAKLITLLINRLKAKPQLIFLVDGAGALLTAFLLGVVLVPYQTSFGMPTTVLYPLSLIALSFALYSFACYFTNPSQWQPFLKIICMANAVYALLSICLVGYHYPKLTILGVLYFTIELVVLIALIRIELLVLGNDQS